MREETGIMDNRIEEFISANKVFTLATSVNDIPYCAICFYAWSPELKLMSFRSHPDTRHSLEISENYRVAGSITIPVTSVTSIKGLQFTGSIIYPDKNIIAKMNRQYLIAFPYAVLSSADLYILQPDFIKLTDNSLGFGKKITWNRLQPHLQE